jgi:hypothetical protein
MPLNAKLALVQQARGPGRTLWKACSSTPRPRSQQVRNELETSGYGLLNLRSSYEWKQVARRCRRRKPVQPALRFATRRSLSRSKANGLRNRRSRNGALALCRCQPAVLSPTATTGRRQGQGSLLPTSERRQEDCRRSRKALALPVGRRRSQGANQYTSFADNASTPPTPPAPPGECWLGRCVSTERSRTERL